MEYINSKTFPVSEEATAEPSLDSGLDVLSAANVNASMLPADSVPTPVPLLTSTHSRPSVPSSVTAPSQPPAELTSDRPTAGDLLEPLGWEDGSGNGDSLGTDGIETLLRRIGENLSSIYGSSISTYLYTMPFRCLPLHLFFSLCLLVRLLPTISTTSVWPSGTWAQR